MILRISDADENRVCFLMIGRTRSVFRRCPEPAQEVDRGASRSDDCRRPCGDEHAEETGEISAPPTDHHGVMVAQEGGRRCAWCMNGVAGWMSIRRASSPVCC